MEIIIQDFKIGDPVKCISKEHVKLVSLSSHVLEIEAVYKSTTTIDMVKIKGIEDQFWSGWFRKLDKKPLFSPGDKVSYTGKTHINLQDKMLEVEAVKHFNMNNQYLLSIKNYPGHYLEEHFEKAKPQVRYPHMREVLLELCNKDIVNEKNYIHFHIVNNRLKEQDSNYTRNDLMLVLRALEQYHVEADIGITSKMNDAITVSICGDAIMEELGSNAPKTLPVEAMLQLCDLLELTLSIDDHKFIYQIGYNGVIYYTDDGSSVA